MDKHMKAIIQTNPDEPRSLELQDTEVPQLRPGEVLVQVKAAGVNRADILQTQGHYPTPPGASEILGLEVAGVIADAGDTDRQVGEEVGALLAGGGYAEYVAVPQGQLVPIPAGWSFKETAAVIEVAATVWSNIAMAANLQARQTILIHGGGGGIGTFAIQVAKQLGATVAVTAGSEAKLESCRQLGADILINYKEQDFAEELKNQCDVVLDIMGAKYLKGNLKALAKDGHMVTIGLQGGRREELNMGILLSKRLTVQGTTLRSRSLEAKAEIVADTVAHVWPMLEDGRVKHSLHATLPLADAARAHQLLVDGEVTGTLVLEV